MIVKLFRSTILVLALLVLVHSCTDQKITSSPPSATPALPLDVTNQSATALPAFNKTIGSPIDRATALRWMTNFAKVNPQTSVTEHFIQATVLKRIISNSACVGISLHYSLDGLGQLHIIPAGIDGTGKMIANIGMDLGGLTIDWPTQLQWMTNYTGNVRSHFFGALTFTRLLTSQVQIVRVTLALDDSGNPQLLLSNASASDPNNYEDASSPCPPVCPI